MISIHFYDEATGLIRSIPLRASEVSDEFLAANTPPGCKPILGVKDALYQRVVNGGLVDYQPPRPDADHEWKGRRWVKRPEAASRDRRIRVAKRQMSALEAQAMKPRAIREAILDENGGKDRMAAMSAQIAELRKIINGQ
jgi:hypothetical protein